MKKILWMAAWDIALFSPTSASFPKSTLAIIGNVHAIRTLSADTRIWTSLALPCYIRKKGKSMHF